MTVAHFIVALSVLASGGASTADTAAQQRVLSGAATAKGEAIALRASAFRRGFKLCSRPAPERMGRFWEVTDPQVRVVDASLMKYLAEPDVSKRLALPPTAYHRQYLGFHRGSEPIIYVNAFPGKTRAGAIDARREFIRGCDGGGLFWGVEYSVRSKSFATVTTN